MCARRTSASPPCRWWSWRRPRSGSAREGVEVNPAQGYIFELLRPLNTGNPFGDFGPGDLVELPALAHLIERLAADGADDFYRGDVARQVADHVREQGGGLTYDDLAGYEVVPREPATVDYRGRRVRTNPPPNAGGPLIAWTLAQLDREPGPPALERLVAAMEEAQGRRMEPGFMESLLGNTTHISVMDGDGMACSVTCTNGEGSGVIVPGTGLHLNNMMGEEDLSPRGYFTHPRGQRLPSMMAPTLVRDATGEIEMALGSAGSNRIRSAILQVISGVIDGGLDVSDAVDAPRVHWEDGVVYSEPGVDNDALRAAGHEVLAFRDRNVFFGGCQAVTRDLRGAGDPRRGGAVVTV